MLSVAQLKLEHIALSVKDITISKEFYTELFVNFLGCQITENLDTFFAVTHGEHFLFEIWQERDEFKLSQFNRYQVGLHHLGILLQNKQQVDEVYQKLLQMQAVILDEPAFYPEYVQDYYAVYFADPNGFKLEFLHYT